MSGHSKWSTIKRKKGANDAQRGKIFSKISKEIMIAVREGGPDPSANTRLRAAIIKGHSENVPNANIERVIKKASGDTEVINYEELYYEGYAPGGVAVLVHCLTDNKNRIGPEVRNVFTKNGTNLGATGCVSYMFQRKGNIIVNKVSYDEDDLLDLVLEAGAEDMLVNQNEYEITTSPEKFSTVMKVLEDNSCEVLYAELSLQPDTYISLDTEMQEKVLKMIDELEELDDVQNVSHNMDMSN